MNILSKTGREDISFVYVGQFKGSGRRIEFVESVQPPIPRERKWVLIVSTLFGCPVQCRICDAGGYYKGKLSEEEIFAQIDYLISNRYPGKKLPLDTLKIQFARMGEPAFNPAVLDVLQKLPQRYNVPSLVPSISTIAPNGTEPFFEKLISIKNSFYKNKKFQMQFSIHTTDRKLRDWMIPVDKWDFARIAEYSAAFYSPGDRKITLNFALAKDTPVDADVLLKYFDPQIFFIKITPVNPTDTARKNMVQSDISPQKYDHDVISKLKKAGYDVLLSIGEWEENTIGSNCGQYVSQSLRTKEELV
jgi:23S rRNA (adenine2503-C2)-methyltransferase